MKIIEIYVNGDLHTLDAANNNHEAGKIIGFRKEFIKKYRGTDVDMKVYIDDKEHKTPGFMTDVKEVAKNMKTRWVENKILGDMEI